ncbi:MAG: RpoP/RPC10 RNA polymerase subunit family protein [Candidatus Freyarchaeum deiterrae]
MAYICGKCGKEITREELSRDRIQCPECGYRVLYKKRPPIVKRVKAL